MARPKKTALAAPVHDEPEDALAFLRRIYLDPTQPLEKRIDCAKAAVGYERPRLAAIRHEADPSTMQPPVTKVVLVAGRREDEP